MLGSVSDSGRNRQLRFRARARFAPEFQLRSDSFRALADARQSPVPQPRACLDDTAVDALSIIANPQPEELAVKGDFGLDAACLRVAEGVAQDLPRNPVDLVLKQRRQGLPHPFQSDLECRRFTLRAGGTRKFLSGGP